MKKALKIVGIILAVIILLPAVLMALLYCEPVQNWAVKKVAAYASEEMGMTVSIEHVSLKFPLDLSIDGVLAVKPNDSIPQQVDTIADVRRAIADIQLWPLLSGQVEVDGVELHQARFNTLDMIGAAKVQGRAGLLSLVSHGIDLSGQQVRLNSIMLRDADIDVQLTDSVPEDTTETETIWKIALDRAQIANTHLHLHMPGDTLAVGAYLGDATVSNGAFDLYKQRYEISSLALCDGRISYDNNFAPRLLAGFDYNHLSFSNLQVQADSILYCAPDLRLTIRNIALKESSGLAIDNLSGHVSMDSLAISLRDFSLATPFSNLRASARVPLNAFDETEPGRINALLEASVGRNDFLLFASPYLPTPLAASWPYAPLNAAVAMEGNMRQMDITTLSLTLPSVFTVSASGTAVNLSDLDQLEAEVDINARTENMSLFTTLLDSDLRKTIAIPSGLVASAHLKAAGPAFDAQLRLQQGSGSAEMKGRFNSKLMTYSATLDSRTLPIRQYLPQMPLSPLSAHLEINGAGTDPFRDLRLKADARVDRFAFEGYDISGSSASISIDRGLAIADVVIENPMIHGTIGGEANINARDLLAAAKYHADLRVTDIPVETLVPDLNATPFTGTIHAEGNGIDPYTDMRLRADASIESFSIEDYDFSNAHAYLTVANGGVEASTLMHNEMLSGTVSVGALLASSDMRATIGCDLAMADLQAMKIVEVPLKTSLCAHVDVATDMDEFYKLQGIVNDMTIRDSANTYRPRSLEMDVLTRRDTTWAKVNTGDFRLDMAASGGYKRLLEVATDLTAELTRQIERKYIDQDSLKQVLPEGHFKLSSGQDNFLARYASSIGIAYDAMHADFTTSPTTGINGTASVDRLIAAGMQIDKINLSALTDEAGFRFRGLVENEKNNPDICFRADFHGDLFATGANVNMQLFDADGKLGIKTGLKANLEEEGIRVEMSEKNSVFGYRNFRANDDNYIFLANDNRLSAYLLLKDDTGTGVHIYSDDENLEALQDLTVGVNHLDLTSILSLVPYAPAITGVLDGDFHLIQTESELSVSTSLGIDNLVYEGSAMGDVATEFVYIPKEDGSHYIDGILLHNDAEVGSIKGTYSAEGPGHLDARFAMDHLPLSLVNGFVPDQIVQLRGFGDGEVEMRGPLNRLDIEGEVNLDAAYLKSVPYGVEVRFDDRPVKIRDSRLWFNNFSVYASNNQPLAINGYVDFANLDNLNANMRMVARNYLIIDAKQQKKSEVYGKTYVNFDASLTGKLEALQMRGKLDVLGNTDMTYILRDSPLTTENRLEGLVDFVDLNAEEEEPSVKKTYEGLYVDLQIAIAQGAHVICALNPAKTNYIDLFGGGDLRMVYSNDELRLTGRYTLNSGEMKYSLPVIPLQTFTIQDGSYVEFTGDVMNPTLNITATETLKSTVTTGGANRSVEFNTGVVISRTLNDMGLEFIIDAPEDMQIHGELQTMGVEERGKLAVTMLTTGMYLADNNMSQFTMNSALSSFLQSEINSIAGNAMRTLDLSIGLDNMTDMSGMLRNDFSFKFAKRFWNNRFSVSVGGKVSTTDAFSDDLLDNVALEYRLDRSASAQAKAFYDRSVYDFLEGYVGQYGLGVVWKKKLQSPKDLLWFLKKPDQTIIPPFAPDYAPQNSSEGERRLTPSATESAERVDTDSIPPLIKEGGNE